MPPTAKERLVARIHQNGDVNDPQTPSPLVSLEEFFDGNDDPGSIGCNLPGGVLPADFRAALTSIRARPDVANVLVQVTMHDDPDAWPFSDTVWIVTSATPQAVHGWMPARLAPDEVLDGFPEDRAIETCTLPPGTRVVGLWYD